MAVYRGRRVSVRLKSRRNGSPALGIYTVSCLSLGLRIAMRAAIIAGSSQTYAEFAAYREKLFFVPENGLSPSLLTGTPRNSRGEDKLELIFVGRLVPYKACDLALRAAAPLLQGIWPASPLSAMAQSGHALSSSRGPLESRKSSHSVDG